MADNVTLPATGSGTATPVVATDDISSVHFQKVKPDVGADGAAQALVPDVTGKLATSSQGNVAHDAVNSGNPGQLGAEAIAYGTNPTAVAAADRTKLYANRAGVLHVLGGHPNIITRRDNFTAAQTDTALVTVGAGAKIFVTQQQFLCDEANTVGVQARTGFGATNTPTGAGVVLSHPGMVPGSGVSRGDGAGLLGVGGDGEDLRLTCEVPTGGSLDVITSYGTIES